MPLEVAWCTAWAEARKIPSIEKLKAEGDFVGVLVDPNKVQQLEFFLCI